MAESNHNGTWTLSHEEYQSLKDDERWRACVEGAGVDNWPGMDYAMADYYSDEDEDDE